MMTRPLLFSGPMVRAILDGRKTETRRPLKVQPREILPPRLRPGRSPSDIRVWFALTERGRTPLENRGKAFRCSYGEIGDRLWVRETWGLVNHGGYAVDPSTLCYRADGEQRLVKPDELLAYNEGRDRPVLPREGWRPSIHMPRWVSRLTIELTAVRVERLQKITLAGARAEGVSEAVSVGKFRQLWDGLNQARGFGWDENPWVWVLTFKKVAA